MSNSLPPSISFLRNLLIGLLLILGAHVTATAQAPLYQLHQDGKIWGYTNTPCNGDGTQCPGWQLLDNNTRTDEIVANQGHLYQRHNDGKIWSYTGTPCNANGTACPGWQLLDNNTRTKAIAAN